MVIREECCASESTKRRGIERAALPCSSCWSSSLSSGCWSGYVAPRYFGQLGKSEVTTARAQVEALGSALDQSRLDTGRYPTTELGLNALVERPRTSPSGTAPTCKKDVPLDPWGKPYLYTAPGERGEYDLVSLGKDGQPGGTAENADITNH